jgi:F-type H+-transporting ATPase subunit delta
VGSAGSLADVINPYAEGLMGVAQKNNLVPQITEDVTFLVQLLSDSESMNGFLSNPLVDDSFKKSLLRKSLADHLHAYTFNFLMLLVDRKRIALLVDICKRYQEIYRKLNNIVLAEVTSAVPLSDAQQDAVRQKVIQITGANAVELETRLDSELIGGVVIKVGSQVLDASLRGQLRRIGLSLSQ